MTALPESPPDTGPNGEAFRARPSRKHAPRASSTGSASPGRVTEVVRMADTHLIDRMWSCAQLSDRQHRAASTLFVIWTRAGLNPKGTMGIDPIRDAMHEEEEESAGGAKSALFTLGPPEGPEGESWKDRHRSIMRALPAKSAGLLDGLMMGQHPGVNWLQSTQCALDDLAEKWGIEKETHT